MAMDTASVERSNITGIVLHVEENDEQPSETLTFHKFHSRTVAVGRKSSQSPTELNPERALFRCPVVSRKHAKITFTEYGNVYIIDLHSHHGTHILRPGDLVSTALKPEIPAVLADGDLITFGKSVGRDDYLARPIVVRIELIFGGDALLPAPLPLPRSLDADAPDGSSQPPSPSQSQAHDHECDEEWPRPTSTGRYGVFLPSPESSPSSSDGESDIQEISPPTSPRDSVPSLPCFSRVGSSVYSVGRLRLLQQILPPVRFPSDTVRSKDLFSFEDIIPQSGVAEEGEDMDLSSSRASSPIEAHSVHEEPSIIGAWPGSPFRISQSLECNFVTLPLVEREIIEISDDDSASPVSDAPVSMPTEESEGGPEMRNDEPAVEMMDVIFGQAESIAEVQTPRPQPEDENIEVAEVGDGSLTFDLSIIEAQVADTYVSTSTSKLRDAVPGRADLVQTELNDLRAAQDKNDDLFNEHVQQTKDRLNVLDNQMRSTQTCLAERSGELDVVQTRLQSLGDAISVLQEHCAMAARVEELVKEVGAAKDMLQETCALQCQTRTQMEQELETVKALRAEAAATVAEARLVCAAAQAPAAQTSNGLKRKRDEVDEGDDVRSVADGSREPVAAPLPSKRRRTLRVITAVARTATVATLGAVAAWSALAYY